MKTNQSSKFKVEAETNDALSMTNTNWAQRTNPNWSSQSQTAWKNHEKLLESARSKGMAPPPPIGVVGTRYTSKASSSFGLLHLASAGLFVAALGVFGFIYLKPLISPNVEDIPVVEVSIPKNPNKIRKAKAPQPASAPSEVASSDATAQPSLAAEAEPTSATQADQGAPSPHQGHAPASEPAVHQPPQNANQ